MKRSIITDMDWHVVFYMDNGGNEPVKDFILGQSDGAIAEILHVFDLLMRFNITLGMPYVEKIGKSGIRELRIKHGSDIYRIFFFAHTGRKFVLLHAIKKKSNRLSQNDVSLAIDRMNDYKARS
ncbi:type II toxin-antitoxin system RelE/ParE family toxin [Candidatus Bathyarchaeota archaeon]|nr:type II toxin-antitoxin system RelE/ParE family toxin [Candidatus Bathyarchaeota archaeon]